MMAGQHSDPLALFVALAAIVFAPEVAHVVGPYLVILFGSTLGASFAMVRREPTTLLGSYMFFLRANGIAVLLTYSIASVVNIYYPLDDMRTWFGVISFVIGFVGDRWPSLFTWAAGKVSKLVDVWIKMRGDGGNHG